MPQGVAAGEPTATSIVVWSRTDRAAVMHVVVTAEGSALRRAVAVGPARDFTGRILFDGLQPNTRYEYVVWFAEAEAWPDAAVPGAEQGRFRTAPLADTAAPLRFVVGGDVGGQNVCRDSRVGYPIFDTLARRSYDFFVALGDMVYADGRCEEAGRYGNRQLPNDGPAVTLPQYWSHWRYNRADPAHRRFLALTPIIAIWDDHEVLNDFGRDKDTSTMPPYAGERLLPLGRQALLDFNPIGDRAPVAPLYREARWGHHAHLVYLDTRSYRDDNAAPDSPDAPKTMLGRTQLSWLVSTLTSSTATWKLVVSSVPLSIPTGTRTARDGWAGGKTPTGFEQELAWLLQHLARESVTGVVFLATDVHFATAFEYRPSAEHPAFVVRELVSGPMHAGVFPRRELDPTFAPRRLFYWGERWPGDTATFDDAVSYFNASDISVSESGDLTLAIVTARGEVVYQQTFPAER